MNREGREGVVIIRGDATGFVQEIIAGPHQFVTVAEFVQEHAAVFRG